MLDDGIQRCCWVTGNHTYIKHSLRIRSYRCEEESAIEREIEYMVEKVEIVLGFLVVWSPVGASPVAVVSSPILVDVIAHSRA